MSLFCVLTAFSRNVSKYIEPNATAKVLLFHQTTKFFTEKLRFFEKKQQKITKNTLFLQKKTANVCKFQKKVLPLHRLSRQPYRKTHLIYICAIINKDGTKKLCLLIIARQSNAHFCRNLTSGPSEKTHTGFSAGCVVRIFLEINF